MGSNPKSLIQAKPLLRPYRWYLIGIVLSLLVLLFYALFNQFIASDNWYTLSFNANIALTILLSAMYVYMLWVSSDQLGAVYNRYYKWMVYLSGPCIFYFLGYVALIYGLGDALHHISYQPHTVHDIVQKEFVDTRKGCKTRLVGSFLKDAMPPNICVSQTHFDELPPRIAIDLIGEQSYFGFHVSRYEYDWIKTATLNATLDTQP
jgi:hypothetical protein